MGILKDLQVHREALGLDGYTDQRSDGDTESEAAHPSLADHPQLHRPTIRWGY